MREILFRAKRYSGEWVYGYYAHQFGAHQILSRDGDEYQHESYHINSETVGQYTGLKDKNGVRIFEGDIVRWKECDHWAPDDGIVSGYVLYVDGQWLIQRPNIRSYLWRVHSLCAIVGNIHDDSELIGGGNE